MPFRSLVNVSLNFVKVISQIPSTSVAFGHSVSRRRVPFSFSRSSYRPTYIRVVKYPPRVLSVVFYGSAQNSTLTHFLVQHCMVLYWCIGSVQTQHREEFWQLRIYSDNSGIESQRRLGIDDQTKTPPLNWLELSS